MENKFQKLASRKILFAFFLFAKLPLAFLAGIRVKQLTNDKAITTVRYRWINTNPFRSMYFACQAMAAEMSTGLLVLNHVYESKPAISMLITKNNAEYFKKVTGRVSFTCEGGESIQRAIAHTRATGEGVELELKSTGVDENANIVSVFTFTWSLKVKAS
jgi:hypothetical protein